MEFIKTPGGQDLRPFGIMSIAVAMVAATFLATSTWERVRVRPESRSIEITGSAKKRIVTDLIEPINGYRLIRRCLSVRISATVKH